MQAPALAGALKTPGILALVLAGVLGIFMYLVPAGSYPVGFDPFWNLHVAKTWAESGFPAAAPEAAFTQLAANYADRQLGFHALLVLVFGSEIDESVVPPLVQGFAVAQTAVVFACMRILRARTSPLWLVLLPALSSTWLFRLTALRDMLLGVLPLLVLMALFATRPPHGRRRLIGLGLLAAAFGYVHGAIVLPVVAAVLVALGHRIAGNGWQARSLLAVLIGLVPALLIRPDLPHNLELLWTLNVRMPVATLTGALEVNPAEFAPPAWSQLASNSAPFLVALGWLGYLALQRRVAWPVGLPAIVFGCGALFGSRMFEIAVPVLVIALAAGTREPLRELRPLGVAIAATLCVLVTVLRQVPAAERSVAWNRVPELRAAAGWLQRVARPGETVFVTDWAVTSPLAYWARGAGLRFTGVTDPSLMWAEDPARFDLWWRVKQGLLGDPVTVMAESFDAKLLVVSNSDAAPGVAPGTTAAYLYRALAAAENRGWSVVSADFGTGPKGYKGYRFER